jgi:hypothetical protein
MGLAGGRSEGKARAPCIDTYTNKVKDKRQDRYTVKYQPPPVTRGKEMRETSPGRRQGKPGREKRPRIPAGTVKK